ncbi:MAG TPA: hypothetical protein PLA41_02485 [Candidatus Pacearchaeota archaeon]|nr:hypothetical protein [Candidatus Pacearchaeota archaeon]HQI74711.1 hypothetical protein [Candidatus Pacearchaeota archaeon]
MIEKIKRYSVFLISMIVIIILATTLSILVKNEKIVSNIVLCDPAFGNIHHGYSEFEAFVDFNPEKIPEGYALAADYEWWPINDPSAVKSTFSEWNNHWQIFEKDGNYSTHESKSMQAYQYSFGAGNAKKDFEWRVIVGLVKIDGKADTRTFPYSGDVIHSKTKILHSDLK